MIKAIVMDFDGVIADSEPLHYKAFLQVARQFGVDFTYEQYLIHYVGYDDRDGFRAILANAVSPPTVTDQLIEKLCHEKFAAFESLVNQGAALIPGSRQFIEHVTGKLPLAIASGATRQDINAILQPIDKIKLFNPIVTADDVARSKPHPQTYALAAQQLAEQNPQANITPDTCLAIEDTPAGLTSAKDAGLLTLALTTTTPAQYLSIAHHTLTSLNDVTIDDLQKLFDN